MKTLIVMVGAAGVGKSTIAKKIVAENEDAVIVSRDQIRFAKLMPGDDYFKYEDEVRKSFYGAIAASIKTHNITIADATHMNKKARHQLLSSIGSLAHVKVYAIWVDKPMSVAIEQNARRSGLAHVPAQTIKNMYKHFAPPSQEEGFDEVYHIA